jgi:CRISPR-associated endonuclease Cas1
MFTHKDIECRSIFVINCIKERNLRVASGELLLEEAEERKTLTKFPFQKILALFIIGPISITTPLLEKCKKFDVALVVMKSNLRPVFFWANHAEANFILHKKQYLFEKENISYAKQIVRNKILNQETALGKIREKSSLLIDAKQTCFDVLEKLSDVVEYDVLMGMEGYVSKKFFESYFENYNWIARLPRAKNDMINATLDIGYTILFNFIEVFLRLFGFDPYVGVYHCLWFKRKSLVCDMMEPFRCLIDIRVRKALNLKQIKNEDFNVVKGEYLLKFEKYAEYSALFIQDLVAHKNEIFSYVRSFYRAFMRENAEIMDPYLLE